MGGGQDAYYVLLRINWTNAVVYMSIHTHSMYSRSSTKRRLRRERLTYRRKRRERQLKD